MSGVSEFFNSLIELSESMVNHSRRIDYVFAIIKTVSHGDEIVDRLSQNRGIRHKELSDIIGIDESTLTCIIDKLENLRLVYSTKVGKFKFYYLSELGQKYKDEKKVQPQMYIQELTLQLEKEREKNRQLERERMKLVYEYLRIKSESIKIKYKQNTAEDIYKNTYREKDIKKAQKKLDKWGRENSLKLSNKCGDLI
ncbi:MAG: helix-turn-helix domain-containing protein [Clostridia bacterium]|nr:helix-turn-helix domain-containing protein [Clostridia bacterium]